MAEQTPLAHALKQACALAELHSITDSITPADFAIQRSPAGQTHATWVDADHVISVVIHDGQTYIAIGEINWIHDNAEPRAPFVDVYLPGDAPAQEVARG